METRVFVCAWQRERARMGQDERRKQSGRHPVRQPFGSIPTVDKWLTLQSDSTFHFNPLRVPLISVAYLQSRMNLVQVDGHHNTRADCFHRPSKPAAGFKTSWRPSNPAKIRHRAENDLIGPARVLMTIGGPFRCALSGPLTPVLRLNALRKRPYLIQARVRLTGKAA
ncbi:hypothetical protein DPX16_12941 [Anabarilius grahami]|uniref:Uncharacterized protein n=1 Tax=Anabarilius grahami TaxID=495550 RepID=A0A3N0XG87_ANAGA|nr:hypothetical protein DPX16_12941 [Anabarilius grahami]